MEPTRSSSPASASLGTADVSPDEQANTAARRRRLERNRASAKRSREAHSSRVAALEDKAQRVPQLEADLRRLKRENDGLQAEIDGLKKQLDTVLAAKSRAVSPPRTSPSSALDTYRRQSADPSVQANVTIPHLKKRAFMVD
jgi:chromosome segregation ATPase